MIITTSVLIGGANRLSPGIDSWVLRPLYRITVYELEYNHRITKDKTNNVTKKNAQKRSGLT